MNFRFAAKMELECPECGEFVPARPTPPYSEHSETCRVVSTWRITQRRRPDGTLPASVDDLSAAELVFHVFAEYYRQEGLLA